MDGGESYKHKKKIRPHFVFYSYPTLPPTEKWIMEEYELDDLDEKILSMMVKDARKPFLEVARECNVSGAAIHQRIQKLINAES